MLLQNENYIEEKCTKPTMQNPFMNVTMNEYQENPKETTTFNIQLEYINSSSNKYLLLILTATSFR